MGLSADNPDKKAAQSPHKRYQEPGKTPVFRLRLTHERAELGFRLIAVAIARKPRLAVKVRALLLKHGVDRLVDLFGGLGRDLRLVH